LEIPICYIKRDNLPENFIQLVTNNFQQADTGTKWSI
jgi:hypothetical protein